MDNHSKLKFLDLRSDCLTSDDTFAFEKHPFGSKLVSRSFLLVASPYEYMSHVPITYNLLGEKIFFRSMVNWGYSK